MKNCTQCLLLCLLLAKAFAEIEASKHFDVKTKEFDFFVFSQLWDVTDCMMWEEEHHKCGEVPNYWTIHGLWPTKKYEIGPLFCNKTMKFDPTKLEPIMDELNKYWPDVHTTYKKGSMGSKGSKFDFWKHEWVKHGTCAAQMEEMNTELKYFSKVVEIYKQLNTLKKLKSNQIIPGNDHTYSYDQFYRALSVKKNSSVVCNTDKKSEINHRIYQIYFCFDKQFNRIHCDQVKGGLNHNCPKNGIYYPVLEQQKSVFLYYFHVAALVSLVAIVTILALFVIVIKAKQRINQRRYQSI